MDRTKAITVALCWIVSLSVSAANLPFSAPKGFTAKHLSYGDEGADCGEVTNPARDFRITYSVGGQFARRAKRPVSQDDSVDAMFYYNETTVDGVEVQIVGYRVEGGKGALRVMMWVPALATHFSAYTTGRTQADLAIRDLVAFKMKKSKSEPRR